MDELIAVGGGGDEDDEEARGTSARPRARSPEPAPDVRVSRVRRPAADRLLRQRLLRRADPRGARRRRRRSTLVGVVVGARSAGRAARQTPTPTPVARPRRRARPALLRPAALRDAEASPRSPRSARAWASSPTTGGSSRRRCSTCRGAGSSTSTRRCCRVIAARRRSRPRSSPATRRPASRSSGWTPGSTPVRSSPAESWPLDVTATAPELEDARRDGRGEPRCAGPRRLAGRLAGRPSRRSEAGATTDPAAAARGRPPRPGRPAAELERQVRAYQPWPGSFVETAGRPARSSGGRSRARPEQDDEPGTSGRPRPAGPALADGRRAPRPGRGPAGRRPADDRAPSSCAAAAATSSPAARADRPAERSGSRPVPTACDNARRDRRPDRRRPVGPPAERRPPAPRAIRGRACPVSPPDDLRTWLDGSRRAGLPSAPGRRRALGGRRAGRRREIADAARQRSAVELDAAFRFDTLAETELRPADGGLTEKALHRLSDGALVESVLMHYPARAGHRERHTVCISSQAGCAVGCPFCATGELGFSRDLETAEIVDQVRCGGAPAGRRRPPAHQRRVHGHGRAAAQPRSRPRGGHRAGRSTPVRARRPAHHGQHERSRAGHPAPDRARRRSSRWRSASTPRATRSATCSCRSTGAGRSPRSSRPRATTPERPAGGSPTR